MTDAELQRELALEDEAVQAGITAYRKTSGRLLEKGLESKIGYGSRLVSVMIEPMSKAIAKFVADAYTTPGPKAKAVQYLEVIDPDVAALITAQTIIDQISISRPLQATCVTIGNNIEDELKYTEFEGMNGKLYRGVLRNLEEHPMGYQNTVRRSMLNRTMKKFHIAWNKWPLSDKLLVGSVLVDLFLTAVTPPLVRMDERVVRRSMRFLVATDELLGYIQNYRSAGELLKPKFFPMVVPPLPWSTPVSGGYRGDKIKSVLIRSRVKSFQRDVRGHQMPLVYDAVNTLQATPWKVNSAMLTVVQEIWDSGMEVKGMPSRFDHPIPPKPADYETSPEVRKAWKKMNADMYRANLTAASKRIQVSKVIYLADRFENEPSIYFPTNLDFRGRAYPMPNYLNPQGCDLAKSLLTFAAGKPVGKEGIRWLAIHLANTFGQDKCGLDEREAWTRQHSAKIESTANDPLSDRWWTEADKPFQFLAAAIEWLGVLHDGGENYVSSLPIQVDGSCNGLQHFSAMSRDEVCGAWVNLLPASKPADIYQTVADAVIERLRAVQDPTNQDRATKWLYYGVNRKLCKRPVMVLPYGGTFQAVRQYVIDGVIERTHDEHNPHPFGTDMIAACHFLALHIWEAMKEIIQGPRKVMDWMQNMSRAMSKKGRPINWTTPTGFWVHQCYPKVGVRIVKIKIGGKFVKISINEAKDRMDKRRQTQAIAPNFVHSLDASALMLTILRCRELGILSFSAVHDSYGTLSADMPVLVNTLRQCFVDMYEKNDVLTQFQEGIRLALPDTQDLPPRPVDGNLQLSSVLQSDFFFA